MFTKAHILFVAESFDKIVLIDRPTDRRGYETELAYEMPSIFTINVSH